MTIFIKGGPNSGRYPKGSGKKNQKKSQYRRMTNRSEMKDIEEQSMNYIKTLSDSDYDVLEMYTSEGYAFINSALRKPDIVPESSSGAQLAKQLKNIFKNAPRTETNLIAKRSFGVDMREKIWNIEIGDEIEDRGFSSTTLDSDYNFQDGLMVEIRIPKGTKGLYLEAITVNTGENEFLLSAGTTFRVVDKDSRGLPILEVIGQE